MPLSLRGSASQTCSSSHLLKSLSCVMTPSFWARESCVHHLSLGLVSSSGSEDPFHSESPWLSGLCNCWMTFSVSFLVHHQSHHSQHHSHVYVFMKNIFSVKWWYSACSRLHTVERGVTSHHHLNSKTPEAAEPADWSFIRSAGGNTQPRVSAASWQVWAAVIMASFDSLQTSC